MGPSEKAQTVNCATLNGGSSAATHDRLDMWVVLAYRVPGQPTRLRGTVRRRIQALGAVYLQQGVVALPNSPSGTAGLRDLQREIEDFGGIGHLLHCRAVACRDALKKRYNQARDTEYLCIVEGCHRLATRIHEESEQVAGIARGRYERTLVPLSDRLAAIQSRDVFDAPGRKLASDAMAECREALRTAMALERHAGDPR